MACMTSQSDVDVLNQPSHKDGTAYGTSRGLDTLEHIPEPKFTRAHANGNSDKLRSKVSHGDSTAAAVQCVRALLQELAGMDDRLRQELSRSLGRRIAAAALAAAPEPQQALQVAHALGCTSHQQSMPVAAAAATSMSRPFWPAASGPWSSSTPSTSRLKGPSSLQARVRRQLENELLQGPYAAALSGRAPRPDEVDSRHRQQQRGRREEDTGARAEVTPSSKAHLNVAAPAAAAAAVQAPNGQEREVPSSTAAPGPADDAAATTSSFACITFALAVHGAVPIVTRNSTGSHSSVARHVKTTAEARVLTKLGTFGRLAGQLVYEEVEETDRTTTEIEPCTPVQQAQGEAATSSGDVSFTGAQHASVPVACGVQGEHTSHPLPQQQHQQQHQQQQTSASAASSSTLGTRPQQRLQGRSMYKNKAVAHHNMFTKGADWSTAKRPATPKPSLIYAGHLPLKAGWQQSLYNNNEARVLSCEV